MGNRLILELIVPLITRCLQTFKNHNHIDNSYLKWVKSKESKRNRHTLRIWENCTEKLPNRQLIWDLFRIVDVILEVENEDIFAHKSLLVSASPVFAVMLESDHFIEKSLPKIKLPFKSVEDIQQLLNFVYPFGHQISGLLFNSDY